MIFGHCLRFLNKVVDTSVVFPHRLGPPYKRALRNLMAEHLKKIIQDSGKFDNGDVKMVTFFFFRKPCSMCLLVHCTTNFITTYSFGSLKFL